MILPKSKKCIFVHIPRTGGVSVEMAFLGGETSGSRHRTWRSFSNDPSLDLTDCFKFTVVRNTYARLLSFYRHHARAPWLSKEHKKIFTEDSVAGFRRWAEEGFTSHVKGKHDRSFFKGNDFLRILPYLTRENQKSIYQDFDAVLNTESLQKDFEAMCVKNDIHPLLALPHKNASNSSYEMGAYDTPTINLVQKHFGDELETFKYKMP